MRNQMKLEANQASPVELCVRQILHHVRVLSLIVLSLVVLSLPSTYAQQCGCFKNANNIGTALQDEHTLTQWQAMHASFPPNQMKNSCMSIQGILTVDKNYSLSKTDVYMGAGSSIFIKSGCTLIIDAASTLDACMGALWHGITVMPGASLIMLNAKVKNALIGVKVMEGANVNIQGTTFDGNYIGVDVKNVPGGAINQSITLFKNRFLCSTTLLPDHDGSLWSDRTVAGIRMKQVTNAKLNANHFQNLYSGILLENCDRVDVKGGTFVHISGDDHQAGQAVHLLNSTNIGLTASTYQSVDIGLLCQGSDVLFSQNMVNARYYGVSGTYLSNRNVRIVDNKHITAGRIGIYMQDCISPNDSGLIEIARNETVYGESGVVIWKNTTPLWIHDNPNVRGDKRDGLQLATCSGTGLIENNQFSSTFPSGEEAIEVVEVQGYAIMNNEAKNASVAMALWNSQGVRLGCNRLSNASVGIYLLDNCAHLDMQNTVFAENLQTGMVLLDQSNISPQVNHGNDWSQSNCLTDAMYIGASPTLGVNSDNLFTVSDGMLPDGLNKVLVFNSNGTLADPAMWFSLGGFDPACPLLAFDSIGSDTEVTERSINDQFADTWEKPQDVHTYAMQVYHKHQHLPFPTHSSLSLSPQPAAHLLQVNFTGNQGEPVRYTIMGANGNVVMRQLRANAGDILDVSAIPQGFYVLLAEHENGFIATEKLIVAR